MEEINNLLTILTILGLVVIMVALWTHFHASNFSSFHGLFPAGASGLLLAVSATVYGYGGFRQPIDYAEEVRDPGKTIPRAIFLTLFIVLALFALECFAYVGAINWHAMKLPIGGWTALSGLQFPFVTVSNGSGLAVIGLMAIVTTMIASFKDGYIYSGGADRRMSHFPWNFGSGLMSDHTRPERSQQAMLGRANGTERLSRPWAHDARQCERPGAGLTKRHGSRHTREPSQVAAQPLWSASACLASS